LAHCSLTAQRSGSARLVQAGADRLLAAKGLPVTVERVALAGGARDQPWSDQFRASLAVNQPLAPVVRRAVAAGQLPLVLAGSCDVCLGILGGFDHAGCGVVWLDAHGDFNTPATTLTGFFPGMALAVLVGHCYRELWAQIGHSAPISEGAVLLLGVRDLDSAERESLDRSALQVVP
jgi:arginase